MVQFGAEYASKRWKRGASGWTAGPMPLTRAAASRYTTGTSGQPSASENNLDHGDEGRDEEAAVALQVHLFPVAWAVVVWVATYLLAGWLVAMTRRASLVCWSVGIFGFAVVYLYAPTRSFRAAQVAVPALLVSVVCYASLYLARPAPIGGLDQDTAARLVVLGGVFVVVAALELWRLLSDLRFPLWGEARVMALVQRSRALGGLIHFTPAGRKFLRERFGATPREFVRTVG